MMSSSFAGKSGFRRIGRTWRSFENGVDDTPELSPRKGNAPVTISYSTAPKENKSVRASNFWPVLALATCRRPSPQPCLGS